MEISRSFDFRFVFLNAWDRCEKMINFKMTETPNEYLIRHTLTEHDRHDLIIDYFGKITALLEHDVEMLMKEVPEIHPKEKILINKKLDRIKRDKQIIQDIDVLVKHFEKGGGFHE